VNLGGGECPLLLIGIEPDRIDGIELARRVRRKLDEAEALRESWRDAYQSGATRSRCMRHSATRPWR